MGQLHEVTGHHSERPLHRRRRLVASRNPDPESGDPLGAAVVSKPRSIVDLFCGLCEGAGLSPVGNISQHDYRSWTRRSVCAETLPKGALRSGRGGAAPGGSRNNEGGAVLAGATFGGCRIGDLNLLPQKPVLAGRVRGKNLTGNR